MLIVFSVFSNAMPMALFNIGGCCYYTIGLFIGKNIAHILIL